MIETDRQDIEFGITCGNRVEIVRRNLDAGAHGLVQSRHDDQILETWNARGKIANGIATVIILAAIAVAVHGDQHFRLDLLETVLCRDLADTRRAERPDRADA